MVVFYRNKRLLVVKNVYVQGFLPVCAFVLFCLCLRAGVLFAKELDDGWFP